MMIKRRFFIVLAFFSLSSNNARADKRMELYVPVVEEIFPSDAPSLQTRTDSWLGVYPIDSHKAVMLASNFQMSGPRCPPTIPNCAPEEKRMRIEIRNNKQLKDLPVMLLHGFRANEGQTIEVAPLSGSGYLGVEGSSVTFPWHGKNYRIEARGTTAKKADNPGSFDLIFTNGLISQRLSVDGFFDDPKLELLWAGDLDGDGRPDLLMNMSPKYGTSIFTLFLSSKAQSNQLVGETVSKKHFGS
jgi:hypothetical protein